MKRLREIGALTLCAGVILSGSLVNANNIEEQNQLSVTIQDTEEFELPKVGIHIPGGIPISDVQHMVYFKVVDADTGLPLQEIRSFEWYIPTFVAYTIEPTTKRLKISYRLAQWDGGIDGQWFNVTELREMEVELNRKGINNSTDNWTNLKIERDNTDAFEIHILKNVSAEEIGGSKNNYLQSITLGEGKLEPEFTKENTQYTLQVNKDTKYLAIYPKAEDPKAEVDEEIVTPLSLGKNHITITVTAENTKQRQYYIDIMRGTEEDKRLEEEKDKLEKESAKVSSSGRYNTDRDLSRFSKVTHVATKVSMDGSMIANSGMKTQEIIPLLSEQQKEQILERFIQKVPYTSLGYTVKVDDMKIATQNMFTDDQIKELIASSEMMAQLGININELVTTVRLQTTGGVVYSDIEENEDIKQPLTRLLV
ncbi:cadherin-like beta sandwich domain-containing protein [Cellulosilyticum ruminicola]|uniref:cadherin-like beta sandwich domain-containing protein n=1 Tax=Cellulosilyticum ruminicola TaxID=425254 RepID=UPI0006D0EFC2|nr:cadherin-like beta sandwich domain-containing protein [Cellulosilyticum ruminicola]